MTLAELETAADLAWDSLGDEVQAALEHVEIVLAATYDDPDLVTKGIGLPPDTRAVFIGDQAELADEDDPGSEGTPAGGVIILVAAMLRDDDDVRLTLLHEVGHALGLDEDEVENLGLE